MADADQIEIGREMSDEATILTPHGEIDLSRAPSLRLQLADALGSGPQKLIIDLEHVNYMDSSGVATLVEAMQLARRKGSKLVLCKLQDRVRSIFEIARLDMVFTIVEGRDDAMAQ